VDDEIMVIGADSTRAFAAKDGGLRQADIRHVAGVLQSADRRVIRIVVCHHPFGPPAGMFIRRARPRLASRALAALVEAGADVFLTGHLHLSYAGRSATRYETAGRSAIAVEAGTATSRRMRGEPNSFNVVRAAADHVEVERLTWDEADREFRRAQLDSFVRSESGWISSLSAESTPAQT
jgi:hypothetical protein